MGKRCAAFFGSKGIITYEALPAMAHTGVSAETLPAAGFNGGKTMKGGDKCM